MGAYSRTYSLTNGTIAYGDQVVFELDALGSSVNNIVNDQISSGANISDSKLAQITSAGKVDGAAITGLANVPSGAGILPAANFTETFAKQLLHIRDEKAANTDGGTFTSGAWRTRDLNTVKTNEITGASLGSNQITLPAGTFYIEASSPAFAVSAHQIKLKNVTDGSDTIIGSTEWSYSSVQSRSVLSGRFTLAAQKVMEIEHYCGVTESTDGFGHKANLGVTEVYTDVKIWKVA